MTGWHLLTGEYPPEAGGVSDYTRQVATALAKAGDAVDVWTPRGMSPPESDPGVVVHALPDRFGPRSLLALGRGLDRSPEPRRVLVQYVPHAFGWKALNVPFCLWLLARRRQACWVVFHEVAYPFGRRQSPAHNVLAGVTHLMALLVARAAERIFIAIPAWEDMLRPLVAPDTVFENFPMPSNVPVLDDRDGTAALRARYWSHGGGIVGHFGTYGDISRVQLRLVLPSVLSSDKTRRALLIGRGSIETREEIVRMHAGLQRRIHATGSLSENDVSRHLSACDVMIQPYVDGISTRRTTAMACLAHGVPMVTTAGALTETFWRDAGVALLVPATDAGAMAARADELLRHPDARHRLGVAAKRLYAERFDIEHTIATLRKLAR